MANSYYDTFNKPTYSLMDEFQLKNSYDNYDSKNNESLSKKNEEPEPWVSKDTQRAAARGAQAGGLSGALMAGGTSAMLNSPSFSAAMSGGGPYAIAGGLLLSELEAAQKEKARVEAEKIQNEKDRMANMQGQLNAQSRTVFRV